MDVAADHLTAELLPRRGRPLARAWHWGVAVLAVASGFGDGVAPVDLVVRRIATGAEVMRTPADVGSPDFLLEQVRDDLASKTVEEFFAEWRLPETG
jgi:hypothetical protein